MKFHKSHDHFEFLSQGSKHQSRSVLRLSSRCGTEKIEIPGPNGADRPKFRNLEPHRTRTSDNQKISDRVTHGRFHIDNDRIWHNECVNFVIFEILPKICQRKYAKILIKILESILWSAIGTISK